MSDYIDREAFRAVLQKSHRYHAGNCREVSLLSRDIRLLNEQPAADVYTEEDVRNAYTNGYSTGMAQGMEKAVVHGRWLDGTCTRCWWEAPDVIGYDGHEYDDWSPTPYCPNCGAKMGGGSDA